MHSHDHTGDLDFSLRPKGSRIEETQATAGAAAATAGRWDAVGPDGFAALQRAAGNSGMAAALAPEEERSPVHDVVSSGGRPLEPEVREDMEGRLGHDFGDVRVHDDGAAHDSAKAVNAHAYTVGSNVVFQRDRYDPGSTEGRTTIAHELTHVVQQRNGPVDGTPAAGGISVSDPGDRFEREAAATAEAAVAAPAPVASPAAAGPAVQREEGDEEEAVQGSFVQREEEEEDVQGSFVQREGEAPAEEEEEAPVQGSFESASVQRHGDDEAEAS